MVVAVDGGRGRVIGRWEGWFGAIRQAMGGSGGERH